MMINAEDLATYILEVASEIPDCDRGHAAEIVRAVASGQGGMITETQAQEILGRAARTCFESLLEK